MLASAPKPRILVLTTLDPRGRYLSSPGGWSQRLSAQRHAERGSHRGDPNRARRRKLDNLADRLVTLGAASGPSIADGPGNGDSEIDRRRPHRTRRSHLPCPFSEDTVKWHIEEPICLELRRSSDRTQAAVTAIPSAGWCRSDRHPTYMHCRMGKRA